MAKFEDLFSHEMYKKMLKKYILVYYQKYASNKLERNCLDKNFHKNEINIQCLYDNIWTVDC